jgi:hypothetical protein
MASNFSNKRYWLHWTIACGMGEFLGIGVAAGIAFLHIHFLGEPQTIGQRLLVIFVMVLAGIIEGLVVGSFQWSVLRRKFVNLKVQNWLIVTALGAATAWLLGMLPSTFFAPEPSAASSESLEFSSAQFALLAVLSGVVLGALFGAFQWVELRKHALNASRWIVANLLGWTVGLAIIYLGASAPLVETGLAAVIMIGTISGLLSGLSVGAITGLFLVKLKSA